MTITISPEHGYVILAASGAFLLNLWQMMKISGKRKELGITVRAIYTSGEPGGREGREGTDSIDFGRLVTPGQSSY